MKRQLPDNIELFQTVIENSKDIIYLTNKNGIVTYISPQIRSLGYAANEFIGKSLYSLVYKDDRKLVKVAFKRTIISAGEHTIEFRMCEASGSISWFEDICTAVTNDKNVVVGSTGIMRDITDRKNAEKALLKSQEKYRDLIETIQEALYTTNKEGVITYISPAIEHILGYEPESLAGKQFDDFIHAEDREYVRSRFTQILSMEKIIDPIEYRAIRKSGEICWLHTWGSPQISNGKIDGISGILSDITHRKILEQQLVYAEKLSAVGQLASGVAHEFNNLLLVILGNAQLGLMGTSVDMMQRALREIQTAATRGGVIVKNLSDYARPKEPVFVKCGIKSVLDCVVRVQKKQLSLKNVAIKKNYSTNAKVMIDRRQVEQVFMNLLINAVHAIRVKGEGTLTISVKESVDSIAIIFSDTGIGMDETVRPRIFEPFFTTKGGFARDGYGLQGTGLGLAVVHTIVSKHGGTITVDSEPLKGTIVTIVLPIVTPEQAEKDEPVLPMLQSVLEQAQSLDILFIDDERNVLTFLKSFVRVFGFANARIANSARKAKTEMALAMPDLIFLDMLMPDINGKQFFGQLQIQYPDIPVIFMSGRLDADRSQLISEGAYDYLQKPFTINELLTTIERFASENI